MTEADIGITNGEVLRRVVFSISPAISSPHSEAELSRVAGSRNQTTAGDSLDSGVPGDLDDLGQQGLVQR